jgi:hypothetical protein
MTFPRRQLLRLLSYAFGSSLILPQIELAAQNPAPPGSPAPPAMPADTHDRGTQMEKVAGIGGFFFRAHDPKALANWYQQHLGTCRTMSLTFMIERNLQRYWPVVGLCIGVYIIIKGTFAHDWTISWRVPEPFKFKPQWYHRLTLVSMGAIVALLSLRLLLK